MWCLGMLGLEGWVRLCLYHLIELRAALQGEHQGPRFPSAGPGIVIVLAPELNKYVTN